MQYFAVQANREISCRVENVHFEALGLDYSRKRLPLILGQIKCRVWRFCSDLVHDQTFWNRDKSIRSLVRAWFKLVVTWMWKRIVVALQRFADSKSMVSRPSHFSNDPKLQPHQITKRVTRCPFSNFKTTRENICTFTCGGLYIYFRLGRRDSTFLFNQARIIGPK